LGGPWPPQGSVDYLQQEPLQHEAPGTQQDALAFATPSVAPTRINNRARARFLISLLQAGIPLQRNNGNGVNGSGEMFLDT
jgi:hypothetical protein